MAFSVGPIICAVTLKLLMCPPKPPPPPPIEALPADASAADVLAWAQQPVASGSRPRNLILFIADGMGATTVAAARKMAQDTAKAGAAVAVAGGDGRSGDGGDGDGSGDGGGGAAEAADTDFRLDFELFPATAVNRTSLYELSSENYAGALSELMTGVPTLPTSIGMDAAALTGSCPAVAPPPPPPAVDPKNKRAVREAAQAAEAAAVAARNSPPVRQHEVPTLLERAKAAGYAAGLVTTGRVTLAGAAAAYAHVTDRNWEIDRRMPEAALAAGCRDIARQLIEFNHPPQHDAEYAKLAAEFSRRAAKLRNVDVNFGRIFTGYGGLDVVLGGGRIAFLPPNQLDPEVAFRRGVRRPLGPGGIDLISQWLGSRAAATYVTGAAALAQKATTAGPLLGLFAPDNMAFDDARQWDGRDEPSLTAMTAVAIDRLTRARAGAPVGYVLIVNAAGIDRAHHLGDTPQALKETLALSDAVREAVTRTRADNDTLIVVTASHGHTLLAAGTARQGAAPAIYPWPTASGEDVPVYARGPGAQFIRGSITASVLHTVLAGAILPQPPAQQPVQPPAGPPAQPPGK